MSASFTLGEPVAHRGGPDGSAGIAVGMDHFIAACDEDNTLRLFTTDGKSPPRPVIDLDPLLGFPPKKSKYRECDIEGASRIGDLVFWIGSHGRNKDGEVREARRVLFATRLSGAGASAGLELHGKPCTGLLDALCADARLQPFRIEEASRRAPEEKDALNIESICFAGDALFIGFRNPIPDRGALVVPLLNPRDAVEGRKLELGDPMNLPLGGQGIRDMAKWNDRLLIIAGSSGDRKAPGARPSTLWLWSGDRTAAPAPLAGDLGDLNPEALLVHGDGPGATVRLLSDDGGDRFRSATVTIRLQD